MVAKTNLEQLKDAAAKSPKLALINIVGSADMNKNVCYECGLPIESGDASTTFTLDGKLGFKHINCEDPTSYYPPAEEKTDE